MVSTRAMLSCVRVTVTGPANAGPRRSPSALTLNLMVPGAVLTPVNFTEEEASVHSTLAPAIRQLVQVIRWSSRRLSWTRTVSGGTPLSSGGVVKPPFTRIRPDEPPRIFTELRYIPAQLGAASCRQPVAGSHESTVQAFWSLQSRGPPAQAPLRHVSFTVQALPSSQAARLFVWVHPLCGSQASF